MDYLKLRDTIQELGLSGSDFQVAAALNLPSVEKRRMLNRNEVLVWAGKDGRLRRIESLAATPVDPQNPTAPTQLLANFAATALRMIEADVDFDPFNATVAQGLAGLVQAGVIVQTEADELTQAASYLVSPATEAGFGRIFPEDVRRARAL